jgi:hypothetical protein
MLGFELHTEFIESSTVKQIQSVQAVKITYHVQKQTKNPHRAHAVSEHI